MNEEYLAYLEAEESFVELDCIYIEDYLPRPVCVVELYSDALSANPFRIPLYLVHGNETTFQRTRRNLASRAPFRMPVPTISCYAE